MFNRQCFTQFSIVQRNVNNIKYFLYLIKAFKQFIKRSANTKENAQLLASRMKDRHFLAKDNTSSRYRERHKSYAKYFTMEGNLGFFCDIVGLLTKIRQQYNRKDWSCLSTARKKV